MLLRNNLYQITASGEGTYTIRFNASHPVFAGHFPGHPIVPGACLVQIAEELLADHLGIRLHFTDLRNLKFRKPVTPDTEVTFMLQPSAKTPDSFTIQLSSNNTVDADFTATYLCTYPDVQ